MSVSSPATSSSGANKLNGSRGGPKKSVIEYRDPPAEVGTQHRVVLAVSDNNNIKLPDMVNYNDALTSFTLSAEVIQDSHQFAQV